MELNSEASFQPTPHIELMAAKLQTVRDDRAKRLIVNVPPRHLSELMLFPNARYDDQVDSTAQALAWAKQRPAGGGMFESWRRLAEVAEGRMPRGA
jgi:hypothetical protein